MSVWEAIILGVVQGLAEFLPVSSSGHLQIAKEVLGVTIDDNLAFDIMLHVATVMATVVVLWRQVTEVLRGVGTGLFRGRRNDATDYALKLLVSMVPVAAVGLLLRDRINDMLASPAILLVVGAMLVLTAGLLVFAERVGTPTADLATQKSAVAISWRDSLIMGVGQAAAAMPGLSRSGTTIATGLLMGGGRAAVAQFSFLMVIVPIVGEALLDVVRGGWRADGGSVFGIAGGDAWAYGAGFVAAFVVGCVACRFMIEMVKRARLRWFALYCGVLGVATIVYYFV